MKTIFFVLLVLIIMSGCAGPKGENGVDGRDGIDGTSCTVTATNTGSIVSCNDGTYAFINNGTNGIDGINGTNGTNGLDGLNGVDGNDSIIQIIDPCGNSLSVIDEVLLKLSDGSYLVYFTNNVNGDYGRRAILPPGSYTTTDGQNCHFIITNNGGYAE